MAGKKSISKKSVKRNEEPESSMAEEKSISEVESHERPNALQQVVEVVEEEPLVQREPPSEIVSEQTFNADPAAINDSEAIPTEDLIPSQHVEKQQELVEELFDRKSISLPEISVHKGNPVLPIILWVIIVVVAALTTGGVLFFAMNRPTVAMPSFLVKPTPTDMPIPTPTPASEVSRSDIRIQVLNGGGIPGAAGKMKKLLEDKGYTVIDVGNTDKYTYTKTVIMVSSDKKDLAELLEGDLKSSYSLDALSMDLPQDSSYDARVIVGKE
ncbi:LytR C-terminal domain-containing protein [Candidatus Gottesmanbacteria bacterium]|nr:LytR C-terminal domain-containing protein [Candidatus Gottesmanbacteria bacterium]